MLSFPSKVTKVANDALVNIRTKMQENSDYFMKGRVKEVKEVKLVGVHVRLGDKQDNNLYGQWALSVDYYQKAIGIIEKRYSSTKYQLAYIFFTGGAVDKNDMQKDTNWTKSNLAEKVKYSFFEPANFDGWTAMYTLAQCDIIIAGQSTFSWWSAYLSNTREVFAPGDYFEPNQKIRFEREDYFLPWWSLLYENPTQDRIYGYH